MIRITTFKTADFDTAAGIFERTNELPETIMGPRQQVEYRFYEADAPEAAKQFRADNKLQNYIAAKKTILRLYRLERDGVRP